LVERETVNTETADQQRINPSKSACFGVDPFLVHTSIRAEELATAN